MSKTTDVGLFSLIFSVLSSVLFFLSSLFFLLCWFDFCPPWFIIFGFFWLLLFPHLSLLLPSSSSSSTSSSSSSSSFLPSFLPSLLPSFLPSFLPCLVVSSSSSSSFLSTHERPVWAGCALHPEAGCGDGCAGVAHHLPLQGTRIF
jgi:hypothetical protein